MGQNRLRQFLSTLSLRRATALASKQNPTEQNFYPRSPCGERLLTTIITICIVPFLSTLSLRRATFNGDHGHIKGDISIHALLAESDSRRFSTRRSASHFYPRSPCGERPRFLRSGPMMRRYFYPRSPCGERRKYLTGAKIHDPDFYPRSPCGERLTSPKSVIYLLDISIHALLAESDRSASRTPTQAKKFLSTLSLRRATNTS